MGGDILHQVWGPLPRVLACTESGSGITLASTESGLTPGVGEGKMWNGKSRQRGLFDQAQAMSAMCPPPLLFWGVFP